MVLAVAGSSGMWYTIWSRPSISTRAGTRISSSYRSSRPSMGYRLLEAPPSALYKGRPRPPAPGSGSSTAPSSASSDAMACCEEMSMMSSVA